MHIPRIYQNTPIQKNVQLTLDAMQHVITVLRLKSGDAVILFNGDNHEYHGTLDIKDKRTAFVTIQKTILANRESPLKIHLAQGIARGEKMDFIIQKAVELGVHEITPLFTERCNVKLDADRLDKRVTHWQQVAISAAEQCGRNQITEIHHPIKFDNFVVQSPAPHRFILSHHAQHTFQQINVETTACTLLVGPEGGFSPEELSYATENHFTPVLLGPRILRTETAALVAMSILQAKLGDLGLHS
jgi:16S rRNA (uracil1498-N3)-methyltransferase